jgi:predicted ArsR family transcriptional regulator
MNLKTRQVLALLSDDLAAHILEQCARKPRSQDDLVKSSGSARKTIDHKLELLEAYGLLAREINRDVVRGRPPTRWQPLLETDLAAFERTADAFVLALLQAQLDDHQDGIDARRVRDLQLSADGPEHNDDSRAQPSGDVTGGDGGERDADRR